MVEQTCVSRSWDLASRGGDIPSRTTACSRQGKPETLELEVTPCNGLLFPSG